MKDIQTVPVGGPTGNVDSDVQRLQAALTTMTAERQRLVLRVEELGMALRQKQEEFLDILDRLQLREEQSVRRSEERFRLLVESVQDYAILMLGPDGDVISWNEGAARISGYEEQDVLGRHVRLFYPPHAVQAQEPERHLDEALRTGRAAFEDWLVRRNATLLWASVLLTALRDDTGRVLGFAAIIRDLTERRRAEEALRLTATDLERSNRDLEQFAFIASHDLQEPLRKIQAFGERLHTQYAAALPDTARDHIARMLSAANRMRALIDDILTLSRVTSRAQPFADLDLAEVVHETLSDLERMIEDTQGRIEIGPLPVIEGDRAQLRRLFQNLIANALKFRKPETPPVIRITAETPPPVFGRPAFCRIRVADNGVGFDEKYQERIFGIFERLHGRGEYEGTGIGLAICRKIVERHGGTITATGTPGAGATFTIQLPLRHRPGVTT